MPWRSRGHRRFRWPCLLADELAEPCYRRAAGAPRIWRRDLVPWVTRTNNAARPRCRIDAGRTPVALLSGDYDYSAPPKDGRTLAGLIPGSFFKVMPGLGHFPMCEES